MKYLWIASLFVIISCGGSKAVSTVPQEKTDHCVFADEVCREAETFQTEYDSRTAEEQKELVTVLNSYIEHCESARKACKKSMR